MRTERIGLGVTVSLHALAAAALLSYEPARQALLAATPIMVELITPPRAEVRPLLPPTELPKPKPVSATAQRLPEPAPVLSVPAESPAAVASSPALQVPALQPGAAEAPASITPPVFNADYLQNPAPAYPALSRRMGEQGRVLLRVLVNATGAADEVQVRTSSGHPRLDESARDTVRRWKFVPARRGADTVPAWVLIPISFQLEG